jgi:carboxypeptidase C (cathepsin A)
LYNPPAHVFSATAAVGLSYSGVRADYATNDTATAADSNAFLRGFFRRYPHLARNHFYISGG